MLDVCFDCFVGEEEEEEEEICWEILKKRMIKISI